MKTRGFIKVNDQIKTKTGVELSVQLEKLKKRGQESCEEARMIQHLLAHPDTTQGTIHYRIGNEKVDRRCSFFVEVVESKPKEEKPKAVKKGKKDA